MAIGSVDFAAAAAEHAAYVSALAHAGASIVMLPFVHGAYDSVFAKDTALVLERRGVKKVLLAQPRHPERQREQVARSDFFERAGYEVVRDLDGPSWEGGDTVMLPRGLLLGYGPRSGPGAAAWLERNAEVAVTPLELCDPHLYHLDMALTTLPDGTAIVCETALTPAAMRALERTPGIRQIATVRRTDALAFGLNLVAVGDTIFAGARVPAVEAIVTARGYRYVVAPLDEFHKAGGSAACLVAKLHRDPEAARETNIAGGSMDVYGPIFRSLLFPFWEHKVRQRPVVRRWRELRRTQWLSADELRARQQHQLARLLHHAYEHVPFYRALFDGVGATPDDALAELPIVRRAALQRAGDAWGSTAAPRPTVRKHTSGTTGEPLVFGYEPDSEHWRRAVKYRGYEWAGYRPGDRALHFWGVPIEEDISWKARMKIALDRRMHRDLYIPCAVMTDERLGEVARVIEFQRPQVIVCYAQAGAELARYINRNGLRAWPTIPVICGAERVLPHDRADLEQAFGPAVFDTYGCREVMMIAAECEAHQGMHVAMENLVVEIVDPDGNPVREGDTGEVVVTDLHNYGQPFIRYANGDIATAGPDRRCPCGRSLPRIQSVQGRISETLRDGNGSAVSGIALSFVVQGVTSSVRQFQAVQHRDRSVTISIVPVHDLPPAVLDEIRATGEKLLAGIDVAVKVVPELPRSAAGKHHLVVVER